MADLHVANTSKSAAKVDLVQGTSPANDNIPGRDLVVILPPFEL